MNYRYNKTFIGRDKNKEKYFSSSCIPTKKALLLLALPTIDNKNIEYQVWTSSLYLKIALKGLSCIVPIFSYLKHDRLVPHQMSVYKMQ